MENVHIQFENDYAIVQINRPKANALNIALVHELIQAFDTVASSSSVRGAIITGQGTVFSAGIDVREMLRYSEDQVDQFWESFANLIRDLSSFPKPLVAAINGHSPAGGCVLALTCDYRIMAEGDFRIGLNEVPVGIVVPPPIVALASYTLGPTKAARAFLNGTLFLPDEARDFGMIDETSPPDLVLSRAEKRLRAFLALPENAWRKTKATLRKPLLDRMNVPFAEGYGETISSWWSKECRDALNRMVEAMAKKKS